MIGYCIGRYQQRQIDKEVPILFIVRKGNKSDEQVEYTAHIGKWLDNESEIDFMANGTLVDCGRDKMFFPDEELLKEIDTSKGSNICYAVNVARIPLLKKGEIYLNKLLLNAWQIGEPEIKEMDFEEE